MRIKVGEIKPEIKKNKLVFTVKQRAQEKSLEEIDNIDDELIELNLQRFLIRKSAELDRVAVGRNSR